MAAIRHTTTAFLGLGQMGYPIAANVCAKYHRDSGKEMLVWNRTTAKADKHALQHGTIVLDDNFRALQQASILFLCLPTSDEVTTTLQRASPYLRRGSVVIDLSSGHPVQSRKLADWLRDFYDITFIDCAVSASTASPPSR